MKTSFLSLLAILVVAASPAKAAPSETDYSPGVSCDSLAAFPDDPFAKSAGVAQADLRPRVVISTCRAALLDGPNARYRFQLARGLLAAGDVEAGMEELRAAGKAGYGAALFLLARHYREGRHVAPSDGVAHTLYIQAFMRGYDKAALDLIELFDDKNSEYFDPDIADQTRMLLGLIPQQ